MVRSLGENGTEHNRILRNKEQFPPDGKGHLIGKQRVFWKCRKSETQYKLTMMLLEVIPRLVETCPALTGLDM